MNKKKNHINVGEIPTQKAHCSRFEQCVFLLNKVKQCSLLVLKPNLLCKRQKIVYNN